MMTDQGNEVLAFLVDADAGADHLDPVRPQAQDPFQPFQLLFHEASIISILPLSSSFPPPTGEEKA